MADLTAISVLGFSILKTILWVGTIWFVLATVRKVHKATKSKSPLSNILWRQKTRITLSVVFLLFMVAYTSKETAYRPKTIIEYSNSQQRKELKALDDKPAPTIPPAFAEMRNWDEVQKKNRKENQQTQEQFKTLPN